MPFKNSSKDMGCHLHEKRITDLEIGSKLIQSRIETIKKGSIMHLFKLVVDSSG